MADHRADSAFRRSIYTHEQAAGKTRTETDGLGSREIPGDAYWGINVLRALENFPISGRPISTYSDLIFGYACVKQAAARANTEIGALDKDKAGLIDRACEEIKDGKFLDQFVVETAPSPWRIETSGRRGPARGSVDRAALSCGQPSRPVRARRIIPAFRPRSRRPSS